MKKIFVLMIIGCFFNVALHAQQTTPAKPPVTLPATPPPPPPSPKDALNSVKHLFKRKHPKTDSSKLPAPPKHPDASDLPAPPKPKE